jgi:hypothetical protein
MSMTFLAGCGLLLWVVTAILVNGIAPLHRWTKLNGLELLGYGAAGGVLVHAIAGCAIAAFPAWRWVFVAILIAFSLFGTVYLVLRRVPEELFRALSLSSKVSLGLWLLLLLCCLALLHVEVQFPESLQDGIYIFKTHTTNVKVQYLTGLPADNYIPFAVAEFFLRGVSFKEERPILPGNEVSNRTILMSLVALPFRIALGAVRDSPQLGTYNYLGQDWSNVWKLNSEDSFQQFSIVGFALNSLLLLGIFVFCSSLGANSILPVATLLYVTNPYFIAQTIYTWPKALAGFFILLAWTSIRRGHSPVVVAALLALAYHSHPYALVFAGCVGLFYLIRSFHEKSQVTSVVQYLAVYGLLLAPWIWWTRFVLQIPSDLVAQNFAGPGTEAAWASPANFVWIRLQNLFDLIGLRPYSAYPFDFWGVLNYWLFCLPVVVGLVLIYPALKQCAALPRPHSILWYGLLGPPLLILAVYSCPALPVLHGYQPVLGVLLFVGVWWLFQHIRRTIFIGLVSLQLLVNLGLVFARGWITGVHLS